MQVSMHMLVGLTVRAEVRCKRAYIVVRIGVDDQKVLQFTVKQVPAGLTN
jgi:hypothetical protein